MVGRKKGRQARFPSPTMANNSGENTISELDTKSKSRKELRIQGREARHRQGTKEALSSTASSQLDTSDGVGSQNTRHMVSTDHGSCRRSFLGVARMSRTKETVGWERTRWSWRALYRRKR